MQGLAVLLFILGVLFIYFGWKAESKPSKELYTALVALSKVKKDVARLEKGYRTLEEKIDLNQRFNQEVKDELGDLRLSMETKMLEQIVAIREQSLLEPSHSAINNDLAVNDLAVSNDPTANNAAVINNALAANNDSAVKEQSPYTSYSAYNPYFIAKNQTAKEKLQAETNVYSIDWLREKGYRQRDNAKVVQPQRISEKYSKVIDLTQKGLSVSQIAQELDISQDAVDMVLRTYQIGGRR